MSELAQRGKKKGISCLGARERRGETDSVLLCCVWMLVKVMSEHITYLYLNSIDEKFHLSPQSIAAFLSLDHALKTFVFCVLFLVWLCAPGLELNVQSSKVNISFKSSSRLDCKS